MPARAADWDRSLIEQVQVDLVGHCRRAASGLSGSGFKEKNEKLTYFTLFRKFTLFNSLS